MFFAISEIVPSSAVVARAYVARPVASRGPLIFFEGSSVTVGASFTVKTDYVRLQGSSVAATATLEDNEDNSIERRSVENT